MIYLILMKHNNYAPLMGMFWSMKHKQKEAQTNTLSPVQFVPRFFVRHVYRSLYLKSLNKIRKAIVW